MRLNKTPIIFLAVSFCLTMLIAPQARANPDIYHLACTAPTVCTQSGGLVTTTSGSATFNIINTSNSGQTLTGEAFVLVFVPDGGGVPTGSGTLVGTFPNFTTNGVSVFAFIPEPGNGTDYNLGTIQNDSLQVGITASSYTVYEFDVGAISNCGKGTCLGPLTYNNLATGSVIISFLEDANGNVIDQNPNSDSITVVPEPSSMALFGSGLLLLGGFLRRYLVF